jgi:zinc-ribbon domain
MNAPDSACSLPELARRESELMFCHNCGTGLTDHVIFCPTCGAPVGAPEEKRPRCGQPSVIKQLFTPVRPSAPEGITESSNRFSVARAVVMLGLIVLLLAIWGGLQDQVSAPVSTVSEQYEANPTGTTDSTSRSSEALRIALRSVPKSAKSFLLVTGPTP